MKCGEKLEPRKARTANVHRTLRSGSNRDLSRARARAQDLWVPSQALRLYQLELRSLLLFYNELEIQPQAPGGRPRFNLNFYCLDAAASAALAEQQRMVETKGWRLSLVRKEAAGIHLAPPHLLRQPEAPTHWQPRPFPTRSPLPRRAAKQRPPRRFRPEGTGPGRPLHPSHAVAAGRGAGGAFAHSRTSR